MAIIKKTLSSKNLANYSVLVNDTDVNSRYFKITELPDTFTGGKNAFLVAGGPELVADTKIQIELKDSNGDVIYHEPGEGLISTAVNGESFITEYYEGVSKVVSVYIYPDTAYGECTLTILGELNQYTDSNGIVVPVPLDWENKYNVKWQKSINVNPSLANTTKIRFYQRPVANITEILSPIYRIENDVKVASDVTQSFANVKLSRLETFAGDVKRVKVYRTSEGDISDYDLIQDILVESKELLTSYGLSGSVVGETGILTSETLKNYWNTGSLNALLTSSRVESGVRLTGSGYFTYTSSLDIKSANTYELNLDAFYSSSTSSNLGIYLSYVSQSTTFTSSIATLTGTNPTKNLLDTVIPFRIDVDYPTASLYFSQSQGEWHLGNISLKLSEDTAFSPDEISFVTTMPTVLGNETFNFKFEFYDVNNNYVPVEVTQSALFTGGNSNINNAILLISASASSSLSSLYAVSSSISGTMTVYSSSASSSVGILSGSVSASINSLSSSVSSSNSFILSSSFSKVQQLANGQYSGSFIGDTVIYSPTIGGQQGYISKLFTVGDTSAARINLDARNTSDGAPDNLRRIWIGTQPYGYHNNTNTSVYLDSAGKFSLGNKLVWDGNNLSVNGSITITNTIPNTSISGLGALATQNTVTNTQVTGLGALATRNNINLSYVTDAGAMAAISSITAGNASTYIGAGAIVSNFIAANTIVASNIASNTITATQIASDTITATNISSLNFTGKTATFDQGTIGGWNLSSTSFNKTVGGVGKMEFKSSDNTISMYDTNNNLRLQLNPTTTLPTLTTPGTSTTIFANDGGTVVIGPGSNLSIPRDATAVSIVLGSSNNEIYVPFDDLLWYDPNQTPETNAAAAFLNPRLNTLLIGEYYLQVVLTGGSISGELVQTIGYIKTSIDSSQNYSNASVYTSPALFSNLPAGTYSLKVRHLAKAEKILGATGIDWRRWAAGFGETDGITVLYGSSNAYSVLNAGGMVISQGSQNYIKIQQPTTGADSFFAVRGKSTFLNGLFVSGSFAANSKQFQITHPLDDKKWLYHTAIEAPKADLIYRGTLELLNGGGNVSIDSASNMIGGTFESLTKNRQVFLQNNQTFDRVKGYIESGSVYVLSENSNSSASIDWLVMAERNDIEIMSSKLYDENGNYKPERYKDYLFQEYLQIESGSI